MVKQKLVISAVTALAIGFFISLIGLAVLLATGQNSFVYGSVILLFVFESWMWFRSDRKISPNILFTIGWYLPAIISFIPIQNLIYSEEPLQYEALFGILLVSVMFYLVSAILRLCLKPRGYNSKLLFLNSQYPLFVISGLFVTSNLGFVIAALNSRFVFPLLQGDITRTASEFFKIQGSATLFSMGLIASLLLLLRAIKNGRVSIKNRPRGLELYAYVFFLLYVVELLLGGKRMDILLLILSSIAALGRIYGIRKRTIAYGTIIIAVVVLGNGYLRGRFDFNQYWKGKSFNGIQSTAAYSIIQPVLYARQAFQNLGDLIKDSGTSGHGTLYTFAKSDGAYLKVSNDLFSDLATHGHMTTAFGAPAFDFGVFGVVLWCVVIFTALWLLYFRSVSACMSAFYAIYCARFALLWTGNFLSTPSLYYYLFVLIAVNVILVNPIFFRNYRGVGRHTASPKRGISVSDD